MSTSPPPVERPETSDLKIVAIKIPRTLVATIDNAAGHSWDTRNAIVRKVLENHFNGNSAA